MRLRIVLIWTAISWLAMIIFDSLINIFVYLLQLARWASLNEVGRMNQGEYHMIVQHYLLPFLSFYYAIVIRLYFRLASLSIEREMR